MAESTFHPRIYPANYPILDRYDSHHAAVHALQVHAEACDTCVCKEIEWPQLGNKAIEQEWFSTVRDKSYLFSEFAYEFLSYDLVLDGWLRMPEEPTRSEQVFLHYLKPLMEAMLLECEDAAARDGNSEVFPLIEKTREFIAAYHEAVVRRFDECGIEG